MTISYTDSESFYDGILAMVSRGLKFKADFDKLEIHLTGGY